VHEDDIPIIAVAGSGGGFKAMIGTTGYLKAMQEHGLYDSVMYVSGRFLSLIF
jgi:cytosolic phospholipase A2